MLPASLHRLVLATQTSTSIAARITNAAREALGRLAQEAAQGSLPGEGLLGPEEVLVPLREGAGRPFAHLRVSRPQEQEADVSAALDHADQRRRPGERTLLQPVHRGAEEGGDRARP